MARRVDKRGIDEFGNFVGQTGLDKFFVGMLTHSVKEVRAFLKYYGLEPIEIGVDPEWLDPTQLNKRGKLKKALVPFGYRLPRGGRYDDWRWPNPPQRSQAEALRLSLEEQVNLARERRRAAKVRWLEKQKIKRRRHEEWVASNAKWSARGKLILTPRDK